MAISTARRRQAASPEVQADTPLNMDGLDDKLGFRLRFAERRVFRELGDGFQSHGISPLLFSILTLLAANPGCRQAELGAALGVHQPNLVEKIDNLVSRGLALRAPDPVDRRANTLHLTKAGEEFLSMLNQIDEDITNRQIQRLGVRDYATLIELLRRLA